MLMPRFPIQGKTLRSTRQWLRWPSYGQSDSHFETIEPDLVRVIAARGSLQIIETTTPRLVLSGVARHASELLLPLKRGGWTTCQMNWSVCI